MRAKSTRRVRPPISERLVVVGGQCSGVGKTTLVVDIIRAMPEFEWTAVKITPHLEGGVPRRNSFSVCHELDPEGRSDTSRFLAAGAVRALWVHTKPRMLRQALRSLRGAVAEARNVIIESDGVVRFWNPDLYLMVLSPAVDDFKESARKLIPAVDVFVYRSPVEPSLSKNWPINARTKRRKSCTILQPLGESLPWKLQEILRQLPCPM